MQIHVLAVNELPCNAKLSFSFDDYEEPEFYVSEEVIKDKDKYNKIFTEAILRLRQ